MKKIIFMGTPKFAVPSLKKLIQENSYEIAGVFTRPDKPAGRGQKLQMSPIKEIAIKNNLPVFQPETLKSKKGAEFVKKINPDLIIVAAYGQIIPQNILDLPFFGTINVHASLLPKYRGASPIQTTILEGETKTGITIMLLDEKMDHGPIISNLESKIMDEDTAETLSVKLAELGADLLAKTLPLWFNGKIEPKEQEHDKAIYTKIIKREDGKIDWTKNARKIERQIRAFTPWPGSFAFWNNKRLKIIKARILNPDNLCPLSDIGRIFAADQNELAVNCKIGNLILEEVQLAGKREISGKEFLRGNQKILGTVLK